MPQARLNLEIWRNRYRHVNLDALLETNERLRLAQFPAWLHKFSWALEFADIFQQCGSFDLILGIRHSRRLPPFMLHANLAASNPDKYVSAANLLNLSRRRELAQSTGVGLPQVNSSQTKVRYRFLMRGTGSVKSRQAGQIYVGDNTVRPYGEPGGFTSLNYS